MVDDTGKDEREDEPADEESSTDSAASSDEHEAQTSSESSHEGEDSSGSEGSHANETSSSSETVTEEDGKPEAAAASADEKDGSEYGGARSDVDAMGNDKRREVVGRQYGATVRKRLLVYGAVVGVFVVGVIAFLTVVKGYDTRDVPLKDTAPWTEAGASQAPPRDVDFKENGPTDTIPADQIVNR